MIRIAIVEDEAAYTKQLTEYIKRFEKEFSKEIKLTFFTDGDEIVEKYTADYDIILMDIQMQFMDGMTAAEKIRQLDKSVIIMFITNMTSYAVRGYEVDALDYIVKPVEYFSFSQKLNRAIERIKKDEEHQILISVESGFRKITLEKLYYVESFGHQLNFITKEGVFTSRVTMTQMESTLLPHGFFRIAKSYLVNLKYVEGIQDGCCLVGGEMLQISRKKRQEFMDILVNYMSEATK